MTVENTKSLDDLREAVFRAFERCLLDGEDEDLCDPAVDALIARARQEGAEEERRSLDGELRSLFAHVRDNLVKHAACHADANAMYDISSDIAEIARWHPVEADHD